MHTNPLYQTETLLRLGRGLAGLGATRLPLRVRLDGLLGLADSTGAGDGRCAEVGAVAGLGGRASNSLVCPNYTVSPSVKIPV